MYAHEPRRGTKQTKSRRVKIVGTGAKSKRKQKAVVKEDGFLETQSREKGLLTTDGASQF